MQEAEKSGDFFCFKDVGNRQRTHTRIHTFIYHICMYVKKKNVIRVCLFNYMYTDVRFKRQFFIFSGVPEERASREHAGIQGAA